MKKLFFILLSLFVLLGTFSSVSAYVSASSNYRLEKDSINTGGSDFSSSPNYLISDTLGEFISGLSNGLGNNASSGYRYMEIDSTAVVIPSVLGCMDPSATNYNALATQSDGSCSYSPPSCVGGACPIFGCTNPNAFNYNRLATVDNGTCSIVKEGILGCIDPRAVNYNPQATEDDKSCSYPPVEPPIVPPGGCTGADCGGFFGQLPTASSSVPLLQKEWNLRFIQPEEKVKTFDWRGIVRLAGEKPVTILFTPNISLDYLKTIGVTLADPQDKTKNFSFLMHRSARALSYEATLSPLIKPGTYPIDIYIINYDNQTIQHIKGKLVIPSPGVLWAETLIAQVSPFVAAGGLAVGFLPTLYDLLLTLLRFIGYFFGRRRHDKPWGTVYDSVTKRPLDPVYVTALQMGVDGKLKEVASAITDIDGRFSFFLPAGTYYLKAGKTHYKFPSEKLAGKSSDEIYEDLYFGAPIVVTGEEIINLNLPMDSVDFDWNEFAKTKTNFFHFYSRRLVWLNRLYNFFFGFGFIVSVGALLLNPALINFVIIFLYVGVVLVNKFWRGKRKPLQIIKAGTGEPLSFAILRVFIPDLNQQIKTVVADKFGRFYLLVRPGVYYYTIEEKQLDGSYLKTYQSSPVNFSKGILTRDISVK